jgi:hypothetical protein
MALTTGTAEKMDKKQPGDGQQAKPERKPQRGRRDDKFKIFSGTANEPLADEICAFLEIPRGQAQLTRFKDGEIYLQILENVRGADVFVVQPTCFPVDQHLMELLLMIDALKRASARRITPVIPYYGYARQDRKDKPRVDGRPARAADPGLLQYSGGPSVRVAGAGGLFPQAGIAEPDGGLSGCRRRGARALFRQEDGSADRDRG